MHPWSRLAVLLCSFMLHGATSVAQGHGREATFHALVGNVNTDVSGEAVASEIELGWHPKNSVQSIGLLVGIFGNPMHHGLLGASLMLTTHFRFSRVQGHVRTGIVHEFFSETRTFSRTIFHLFGTGNISPSFLAEANYQPSSWGQPSYDALRANAGVGPSFLISSGKTTIHALLVFSVLNVLDGMVLSGERSNWELGPRIIAEYQFL